MHAWKLFLKYYEMKVNSLSCDNFFSTGFNFQHGNDFANSPARKLSESFSLDVIGGKPITLKQVLYETFF